jgi:O-antigen/teichoic acid export membrane protein
MGIVQKQTIKGSVYSYFGVIIGFLNMGVLAPNIFTPEQIGLTQVLYSIAVILGQMGNLGFVDMSNRIFPWFRDKVTRNKGFFGLGLVITLAGTLLVTTLLVLNLDYVITSQSERSSLLADYAGLLPLMLVLIIWFTFFDNYVKILFNAVLGTFLRDLLTRILNLALIVLFFTRVINFDAYVFLYVLNQGAISVLVLIIYLIRKGEFSVGKFWRYIDRKMAGELARLAMYGLVAGMSGVALYSLDKFLVNYYLGLSAAGIYSISFYFATIIMIPSRSLAKIAIPVAADAWKRGDMSVIDNLYRKSCINQIVFSALLVAGILANIGNIYRILPEVYRGGEMVIILISLSNLVNNATGASISILGTSEYYRFHTWLMLLLTVLVVVTNALFIPAFGLTGAALASLVSVIITSALRIYVLYRKTGLWPYDRKAPLAILAAITAYLISLLIPELALIADIAIRSLLIGVLFFTAVYFLNLSDDLKGIADKVLMVIRNKIKG